MKKILIAALAAVISVSTVLGFAGCKVDGKEPVNDSDATITTPETPENPPVVDQTPDDEDKEEPSDPDHEQPENPPVADPTEPDESEKEFPENPGQDPETPPVESENKLRDEQGNWNRVALGNVLTGYLNNDNIKQVLYVYVSDTGAQFATYYLLNQVPYFRTYKIATEKVWNAVKECQTSEEMILAWQLTKKNNCCQQFN